MSVHFSRKVKRHGEHARQCLAAGGGEVQESDHDFIKPSFFVSFWGGEYPNYSLDQQMNDEDPINHLGPERPSRTIVILLFAKHTQFSSVQSQFSSIQSRMQAGSFIFKSDWGSDPSDACPLITSQCGRLYADPFSTCVRPYGLR